jgi:hypothetical protein
MLLAFCAQFDNPTATFKEVFNCSRGQTGYKMLQNQSKILAKPKGRGKIPFSTDSGVFRPPESESEVSFLPKKSPDPQMELLILLVRNCTRSKIWSDKLMIS